MITKTRHGYTVIPVQQCPPLLQLLGSSITIILLDLLKMTWSYIEVFCFAHKISYVMLY